MIARALIHQPSILFLDEPSAGVDIEIRASTWEFLKKINQEDGVTIVLTTHYLEEAEQLADRVAVMSGGRIVAEGTPESLRANADRGTVIRFALPAVHAPLSELIDPLVGDASGRDRRIEIVTMAPTSDLAHITTWALGHGIELQGLVVESMNLEDVYLELVADDAGATS